ncbi:TIR domain-containing protein [Bacillus thuringiensis]|uniref:TIR domain-containing protein n=1 Tax=Bacillus thuringiensis TaxID=1428 RepID=UPI00211D6B26|nr:TIR domain-containing protein [Bacillus thuringiensis]
MHNAKNDAELYEAIKKQISPSSVVLILAGVYSTYSKWINHEIDISKNGFATVKPIIAIEPWASEKTSKKVKDNADKIVKWQSSSIISAIKELN